jgi:hypothetical protein
MKRPISVERDDIKNVCLSLLKTGLDQLDDSQKAVLYQVFGETNHTAVCKILLQKLEELPAKKTNTAVTPTMNQSAKPVQRVQAVKPVRAVKSDKINKYYLPKMKEMEDAIKNQDYEKILELFKQRIGIPHPFYIKITESLKEKTIFNSAESFAKEDKNIVIPEHMKHLAPAISDLFNFIKQYGKWESLPEWRIFLNDEKGSGWGYKLTDRYSFVPNNVESRNGVPEHD